LRANEIAKPLQMASKEHQKGTKKRRQRSGKKTAKYYNYLPISNRRNSKIKFDSSVENDNFPTIWEYKTT